MTIMRGLVALVATLGLTAAALGDERILDYRSAINVAGDGTMEVTETLGVRVEGQRIKHGIYRDFPTDYSDRFGKRVRVDFTLLDAQRDGQPEKWHSERLSNGVRVYIGSADVWVDPGNHEFSLRYRTSRQLGFFADHDELYWNVTGNGWDFPIDQVAANVVLPGAVPAEQLRLAAYTGAQGAKGQSFRASADAPSQATFRTTRGLGPREGITIVVEFPKGLIAAPASGQRLAWLFADNLHVVAGCIGLGVIVLYLLTAWWRVGRDPRRGPIMPEYEAPDGYTPAELRYVERMGYDDRCFAADLVDLGVHGALRIDKTGKQFVLRSRAFERAGVPALELALRDNLLGDRDELVMEQSEHVRIGGARKAHAAGIDAERGNDRYFRTNRKKLATAVVLSIATIFTVDAFAGVTIRDSNDRLLPIPVLLFISLFLLIFGSLAAGSATYLWKRWQATTSALSLAGRLLRDSLKIVGVLVLVAIYAVIGLPAGYFGVALAVTLLGVVTIAAALLPAPTPLGRRLLDKIAGLRLYLGVAERETLARMQTPQMTLKEYERFLPYALALDVEKTWSDRFAAALGPAAVAAAATSMAWYHGGSSSFNSFAGSIGDSLSSTISSSSSAPGSSSGSGGGGSSGGGGGGGGGGGW